MATTINDSERSALIKINELAEDLTTPEYRRHVVPALMAISRLASQGASWSDYHKGLYNAFTVMELKDVVDLKFLEMFLKAVDLTKEFSDVELSGIVACQLRQQQSAVVDLFLEHVPIKFTNAKDVSKLILIEEAVKHRLLNLLQDLYDDGVDFTLPYRIRKKPIGSDVAIYHSILDFNKSISEKTHKASNVQDLLHFFDEVVNDETRSQQAYDIALALWLGGLRLPSCLKDLDEDDQQILDKMKSRFFEEFDRRKILGNLHGIPNTEDFPYEAVFSPHRKALQNIFAKSMDALPEKLQPLLPEDACKDLSAALKKDQPSSLKILQAGHQGHAAFVILDKEGGYMVMCNRIANLRDHMSTIQAYCIDTDKVTAEVLEEIEVMQEKPEEEATKYFYTELPKKLSSKEEIVKDEKCKALEAISPKPQSTGNCYAAALKTVVRASAALLLFFSFPDTDIKEVAETAKTFSKGFSTHMRLESLEKYALDNISIRDGDLFDEHLFEIASAKCFERESTALFNLEKYPFLFFTKQEIDAQALKD